MIIVASFNWRIILQFIRESIMIGPNKADNVKRSSKEENDQNLNKDGVMNEIKMEIKENPDQISKSFYQMGIPVENFVVLKQHQKAVSCIAMDPKGFIMATGGLDYHVRLWHFSSMNKNMSSFRVLEPLIGNTVKSLSFNPAGTHILVINRGKQITFLDRDGIKILSTVKGYTYVKQLHHTRGHTATVYDGKFHPFNSNQFASGSGDGTIRLWDMEKKLEGTQQQLGHKNLIKCKDSKGLMTACTSLGYIEDRSMVFGGCLDGSLQGFCTKNNLHRPEILIRNAHRSQEEYSSILSMDNGRKIASRNGDGTLKIWDTRNFTKPIVHYDNLPCSFPGSKMCLSPNEKYLLVGTSLCRERPEKEGYLHFLQTISFNKLKTINFGENSINDVTWNKEINQIAIGTSQGEAILYFDQNLSKKGGLQTVNKQRRVDKDPKFDYSHRIYSTHFLSLDQKRSPNDTKKDPIKTHKQLLQQGSNKDANKNLIFTQFSYLIGPLNANDEVIDDARKPLQKIGRCIDCQRQYTKIHCQIQPPSQQIDGSKKQPQYLQILGKQKKICFYCGLKRCQCAQNKRYECEQEDEASQDKF